MQLCTRQNFTNVKLFNWIYLKNLIIEVFEVQVRVWNGVYHWNTDGSGGSLESCSDIEVQNCRISKIDVHQYKTCTNLEVTSFHRQLCVITKT